MKTKTYDVIDTLLDQEPVNGYHEPSYHRGVCDGYTDALVAILESHTMADGIAKLRTLAEDVQQVRFDG